MSSEAPKPSGQYELFNNDRQDCTVTPPQYTVNQGYPPNSIPQVVTQPAMQSFHVEAREEPWSWCNLVTAIISFFCCTLLGFIATVMAILSYVDHRGKEYERSRAKRSVAYGLGITAIVIGSIVVVIVIIVVATGAAEVTKMVNTAYNNEYNGMDNN